MLIFNITLAIFFALNMGGASFAASFSAAYGSGIVERRKAKFLFLFFVILGAVIFGQNVAVTLGQRIIPPELVLGKALLIIFLTASLSMLTSNLMKIPQSTSLVTVAAIAGVGLHYHDIDGGTIGYMVPFWILLPVASYLLTYFAAGFMYPPRKKNFWIYERFVNHQNKLKIFVIICSCYTAFSVGTNNVANVVGPLINTEKLAGVLGLFSFGIAYGLGSFAFTGPLKTAGQKIVPLGLLTASIISIVSGTLMIVASIYGVPQSFVMLQMGALFAIGSLKNGPDITFQDPITRKTLFTWTINPLLTLLISWGLSALLLG